MRALKDIDVVDVPEEEIQGMLDRVRAVVNPEDYETIETCVESSKNLYGLIELVKDKEISIKKLLGMLFGAGTEKTEKILAECREKEEKNERDKTAEAEKKQTRRKKRKGHGRNGVDKYEGAQRIPVKHPEFELGCDCPKCEKGKVYRQNKTGRVLRVTGSPCLAARVYMPEKWRCNLCGEVYTAPLPPEAGNKKYDETAGSAIALLKYGSGMPFNRLEDFQEACGVPLPAATQWEIVEGVSRRAEAIYEAMMELAAQGEIIHNDDTSMTILSMPAGGEDPEKPGRKGVFTTGIVAVGDGREIALFFTGREHAGENLSKVLQRRRTDLDTPLQMCDGLSRNAPKEFDTILANCMAHGRRQFVDIVGSFPGGCRYVLEQLRDVYRNDAICRKRSMSPDERLVFHQTKSGKIMEELQAWMEAQIKEKRVEPNSSMGKAITYMLKRWEELTRFLQVPGAPLDNNICERALKRAILHRKNAYFFKTENGARVGDILMSIIHTCRLCGANPFEYLTEIQRHPRKVREAAGEWMPWNYKDAIELLDSS